MPEGNPCQKLFYFYGSGIPVPFWNAFGPPAGPQ
jgi:hypothetical protein